MTNLIRTLEQAEAGSSELDEAIAQSVYPGLEHRAIAFGTDQGKWFLDGIHVRIEPYTRSLDAAMSLAAKGFYCRVEPRFLIDGERVEWRAYCIKPIWDHWTPYDDWFLTYEAKGKTPEFAMILAALRSRVADNGEG